MKIYRILLLLITSYTSLGLQAQLDHTTRVKPDINYTANRQRYELGGLTVEGIKGYDDQMLLNLSGLNIGQVYEIPGTDISEAVRRYWDQKLVSDVQIVADSIVGNKIYLHIKLTPLP
ncbi:hypothetical protein, secreted, partial [gut metagenome]